MNRDKLDRLLEDVCNEEYEKIEGLKDIEIPDISDAMKTFKSRLASDHDSGIKGTPSVHERRINWKRILSLTACVVLCSIVLSIIWQTPQVQALKSRIIKTIFIIKGDITTIKQTDTDYSSLPKGRIPPPPPDDFDEGPPPAEQPHPDTLPEPSQVQEQEKVKTLILTLDQAREEVPFALLMPDYLPEGYSIKEVEVKPFSADFYIVEQRYENSKGEVIRIVQHSGIKNFASSTSTRLEVEKVEVMGVEAIMITNRTDYSTVYWHKGESRYEVAGDLSDKEMKKILAALKLEE